MIHFKILQVAPKKLLSTQITLRSHTGQKLSVLGIWKLICFIQSVKCEIEFYFVNSEKPEILGLPTCTQLILIERIDSVEVHNNN